MKTRTSIRKIVIVTLTVNLIILLIVQIGLSYYLVKETRSLIMSNLENEMTQISNSLNRELKHIRDIGSTIGYNREVQRSLGATEYSERISTIDYFWEFSSVLIKQNEIIVDISLADGTDRIYRSVNELFTYLRYLGYLEKIEQQEMDNSLTYLSWAVEDKNWSDYLVYRFPFYPIEKAVGSSLPLGYCHIILSVEEIQQLFEGMGQFSETAYYIMDEKDNIIVSKDLPSGDYNLDQIKDNSEKFLINDKRIEGLDWHLLHIFPLSRIYEKIRPLIVIVLIMIVIILIQIFLLRQVIFRVFTRPLTSLLAFVDNRESLAVVPDLPELGDNEIGYIGRSIEEMLKKIQTITRDELKAERRIHELEMDHRMAELEAYQAQMNPHFVFNTLECIRSFSLDYDAQEIEIISTAMAEILRYSLKAPNFVTIEEEINVVSEYLSIMEIRFHPRYQFSFQIDPEIYSLYTLKMLIQPLVENAFYHGLESRETGRIVIAGRFSGDDILFSISDTGEGIPEKQLKNLKRSLGMTPAEQKNQGRRMVGLYNTHRRIRAAFGDDYGLEIESRRDKGTKVMIKIPKVTNPS